MRISAWALLAPLLFLPTLAAAQSGYIAPDGINRYPGVTIFCPNGTGVLPCSLGGSGGGAVTINLGGSAVAAGNPFPVKDSLLDALISGGALQVGGTFWQTTQPVSIASLPLPVKDSALESLISGGALQVGGTFWQATQPVSIANLPLPVKDSALEALISGGALQVGGTFWQTTQPVSLSTMPLPAGASTDASVTAPFAPVAPATATASKSLLLGCLSNTTLPSFATGQEGAVPCDSSGRPYVVTVPSSNNVPAYLQAVSSGGATAFSITNAAASCMAANLKTSSGLVYSYSVSNSNTAGVWFRIFASATAPTCGSGTPVKRIYIPGGATVALSTAVGWAIFNGIGFDVTSGSGADSDTTTVATANSVLVNIDYK